MRLPRPNSQESHSEVEAKEAKRWPVPSLTGLRIPKAGGLRAFKKGLVLTGFWVGFLDDLSDGF